MEKKLIQPKILKGFRDYLPEIMIPRKRMINKIEQIFESFGFAPIDTPSLEYTEILLGKGGEETDKQLFRFNDNGGRDVTMRFDLTVPLARFSAQHYNDLGMPFRAFHIAPVWRGENTHKGRYREFYQCDFDILGSNSIFSDIEIASVIYNVISELISSDKFTIRINNRMILNGLMNKLALEAKTVEILRVLDKIYKVSNEKIREELTSKLQLSEVQADEVMSFVSLKGSNQEIIKILEENFSDNQMARQGINVLKEIISSLSAQEIPENCYQIDLSIARGLDYYTGTVFETMLTDLPGIGSICSGGRYDNLAGLYTNQHIPGVGASVGLDRLLAAMEELERLEKRNSPAHLMIARMDNKFQNEYLKLAKHLRKAGIKTEVYSEEKKLDKQLKYANRKGYKIVITNGSDEFSANKVKFKNMESGENFEKSFEEITEALKELL